MSKKSSNISRIKINPRKNVTNPLYHQNVRLNLLHTSGEFPNSSNKSSQFMEKIFANRSAYLRQMCDKLGFDRKSYVVFGPVNDTFCIPGRRSYGYSECTFTGNFHLARFSSSMICSINKVASTTVVGSVLKASNLEIDEESPHVRARILNPETVEEFLFAEKYFFKFVIVRHPFRRLLSAYLDKVELERKDEPGSLQLRENILTYAKKYKNPSSNDENENENTWFPNSLDLKNNKSEFPTFEDFLLFITSFDIRGEGFHSHWVPYWKRCAPCSFPYDVILKLDSGYSELKYIWPAIGLSSSELPWTQKSVNKEESEEKLMKKYYSALSVDIIMRVYHSFVLDYKLFNYSICDVLVLGDHCKDIECCNRIIYKYFPYLPL